MRRFRWIMMPILIAVLATGGAAHAQSQSLYWERFDVNITVMSNGDFAVEEVQDIVFTSGEFHFGYRNIPMDRLENITNVEVWEGNRRYEAGAGGEYTFSTAVEEGDFVIKWYFPYTSDSSHTFILRYTVQGGLRYYEGGDQLYWKAVYADRDFPVYHSTVTVNLPEGAATGPLASYDTQASVSGQGTNTVVFTAQETVDPGQEFEVRVQFPHGIVAGTEPAWQGAYDRQVEWRERYKPLVDVGLGLIGALVLIGGPLSLLLLWYLRGRDPRVAMPASYLSEPPSDDPPGVAGTLVDEKADMQDIVATLVDLGRRGYLTIEEERKSGFLGMTNFDFTFRRTDKPTDDLRPYERTLLDKVFGRRDHRRMSDLRDRFYTAIPKIQTQLYDELVRRGYFQASPNKVRRRYTLLGFALLVGTVVGGVCLAVALAEYTVMVVCPPAGLAVTAVGLVIVGQFMAAKTRQGAEQAARWTAFKRYLEQIERYTDLSQAAGQFEKYLPYAVAFGLEKSWVRKFSRLETTYVPVPTWYVPAPIYTGTGGGRPPGLGRAAETGGPAPSLDSLSGGLGSGLDSIATGLGRMLDASASTFASSPSSSGGGGGGFSGGGGGGGSGGGGGGGGFG